MCNALLSATFHFNYSTFMAMPSFCNRCQPSAAFCTCVRFFIIFMWNSLFVIDIVALATRILVLAYILAMECIRPNGHTNFKYNKYFVAAFICIIIIETIFMESSKQCQTIFVLTNCEGWGKWAASHHKRCLINYKFFRWTQKMAEFYHYLMFEPVHR